MSPHPSPLFPLLSALLALTSGAMAAPVLAQAPANHGQCRTGPWGKLSYRETYLEAPAELLKYYPLPSTTPSWSLPLNGLAEFDAVLDQAGIAASVRKLLLNPEKCIHLNESISVFPSADFILKLSPEARSIIYRYLGQHAENEFMRNPVFFGRGGVDRWLESTPIPDRTRQLIKQLAWKRGQAWVLSDLEVLLGAASSDMDAKELFRTCSRTRTLILELTIDDADSLASLRKYWAVGPNESMAAPFLESLREAAPQGPIRTDICHLFSPLARQIIYTYPDMSRAKNGRFPDCHWTSLNFFNYAPVEYYLNTRLAADTVLSDYSKVAAPYAFGDVLFFMKDGGAIHSCVQIADDVVFTKNGDNAVNPWMLAHMEEVQDVYGSEEGVTIQGFRKKTAAELALELSPPVKPLLTK